MEGCSILTCKTSPASVFESSIPYWTVSDLGCKARIIESCAANIDEFTR
jgi:hypothetical protein